MERGTEERILTSHSTLDKVLALKGATMSASSTVARCEEEATRKEQQQQEEEEMVDGRPAVSADKYVASVFAEKERRIIGALGT